MTFFAKYVHFPFLAIQESITVKFHCIIECVPAACVFVCNGCGRACRSRIGLFSHDRTSEYACRNRAKSWTCPTTAYYFCFRVKGGWVGGGGGGGQPPKAVV